MPKLFQEQSEECPLMRLLRKAVTALAKGFSRLCRRIRSAFKRRRKCCGAEEVRREARKLADQPNSELVRNVQDFLDQLSIECLRRGGADRIAMLQEVRDFMTSTKNYLLRELNTGCCEEEASVLEELVQRLLVAPLYERLLRDQVHRMCDSGDVTALASALRRYTGVSLQELGAQEGLTVPPEALDKAVERLEDMLSVHTPAEKVRCLADATKEVCQAMQSSKEGGYVVGGDDLLPLMSWVLLQAGMVTAEAESELMWYLLPEEQQNGESGYYITTYWSAAHVVKSLDAQLSKGGSPEAAPRRRRRRRTRQTSEGYWSDPEAGASDDECDQEARRRRVSCGDQEAPPPPAERFEMTPPERRRRKPQASEKLLDFLLQSDCPCLADCAQRGMRCGACVHSRTALVGSAGTLFSVVPVLMNAICVA